MNRRLHLKVFKKTDSMILQPVGVNLFSGSFALCGLSANSYVEVIKCYNMCIHLADLSDSKRENSSHLDRDIQSSLLMIHLILCEHV